MTTRDIVFALIGVIAGASGILAVTTRQVVHSALWLVVCLGTLAGCYVVLGAELVALVQVLIYVGAVVVLVLFALMLTRSPIGPGQQLGTPLLQRVLGAALGIATAGLLAAMLIPLVGMDAVQPKSGDTHAVASAIFGTWVWPFELLSLLLLAALIGAFAIAKVAGAVPMPKPSRRRQAAEQAAERQAAEREAAERSGVGRAGAGPAAAETTAAETTGTGPSEAGR